MPDNHYYDYPVFFISANKERVNECSRSHRPSEDEIQVSASEICSEIARVERVHVIHRLLAAGNLYFLFSKNH